MMHNLVGIYIAVTVALSLSLQGCGHSYVAMPDDPRYAPIIPDIAAEPIPVGGSLFTADTGLALYQDSKAHRVGDILTVKLTESMKATKDAKTSFKKDYSNSLTSPTIMGVVNPNIKLLGRIPLLGSLINEDRSPLDQATLNQAADMAREFSGEGDSEQNNSITGDITVTVAQILPNKNLVIRGEKWMTLNQGSEYIRLSGIVRPQDIDPNNEVLSTRVANARITYSGKGDIHNANTPSILAKFFNSAWFPL